MSYNPRMAARKSIPAKHPAGKEKLKTQSVTVRLSATHLSSLDELELRDGVQRSAQIQRAIAEYLERRQK